MNDHAKEDAHSLFQFFRMELSEAVAGHEAQIDTLALTATRMVMGDQMLRVLLIGSSGVGKTTLARKLGESLGGLFLEFSAAHMVEEGWKGVGPSEHLLGLLNRASAKSNSPHQAMELSERSVVFIDELDKIRRPETDASPANLEQKLGKQLGLMNFIGDGVITIDRGSSPAVEWRSRRALVIAAGVFDGLEVENPSGGDLARWGLIPELAERLARGTILRLPKLTRAQVVRALRTEIEPLHALFRRFGYSLEIGDSTLNFVSARLVTGAHESGFRTAAGWIERSAEGTLIRLLKEEVPSGVVVLTPDDVGIPPPPSPRNRG